MDQLFAKTSLKCPEKMVEENNRKHVVWLARLDPCDITLYVFNRKCCKKGL